MNIPAKLTSRKLWTTVVTIAIIASQQLTGLDLSAVQTAALAAVAAGYVLAQAVVDAVEKAKTP